jgi:hypothetical protein
MAFAGPHYQASGQTQQKAPFPTVPLLLCLYLLQQERVQRAITMQ